MEGNKRIRTYVQDDGEVKEVLDFLLSINYREAKTRSRVISKLCEVLYARMDILNDDLIYFDLNQQFKEYARNKNQNKE